VFEVAVEDSFDFLSGEYAALFGASAATAFQHPVWLDALYKGLLSHNHARPLIVVVRRDSVLTMVLPLVRRRYGALRVIEFADMRVSDYVSAVADRSSFVAMLADTGLVKRLRKVIEPYDLLRIGKLASGSLPMYRLFGIIEPELMATNAYAVPLSGSFEDWRAKSLNASYAKELTKKGRQLARKGELVFERVTDSGAIAQTFEALKIFRRDRFEINGGGELLQVPAYYEFYNAIARQTEFARTYRMTLDGEPIAGALGLAHRGALLVILGGFTQTAHKNKSVGSLLFQEIARDSIERGDTLLDFTIGDEPYKTTFGATPSSMWQMSRAGSAFGYAAAVVVDRMPAARAMARSIFHRGHDRKVQAPQSIDDHDDGGEAPVTQTRAVSVRS
jgi:CelD/BcsL family acetyltransferase involved in cellulose biosynthesis